MVQYSSKIRHSTNSPTLTMSMVQNTRPHSIHCSLLIVTIYFRLLSFNEAKSGPGCSLIITYFAPIFKVLPYRAAE